MKWYRNKRPLSELKPGTWICWFDDINHTGLTLILSLKKGKLIVLDVEQDGTCAPYVWEAPDVQDQIPAMVFK